MSPNITPKQMKRCTNLDYIRDLTNGDPKMMMELVAVYLVENPKFVKRIDEAINNSDWTTVAKAAHAIIPSFLIVGISNEFALAAHKIQEFAEKKENPDMIRELFAAIESVCRQAYEELEKELELLKTF